MALGVLCLGLALAPAAALADDPYSGPHVGDYGPHWLRDSPEYPGVRCTHDADRYIAKMQIRPPVVQATGSCRAPDRGRERESAPVLRERARCGLCCARHA